MSEGMQYPNSRMSPGAGRPAPQPEYNDRPDQGPITGPDRDSLTYPSLAAEGRWELEIPLANSTNSLCKVEKVQVRNLGRHIAEQTERAFRVSAANACGTLSWYVTHLKAAKLFDAGTQGHMEKLVNGFASSSKPEQYFINNVQPCLMSLVPQRG